MYSVDTVHSFSESSNLGASLVVHTSVPFGIKHLETEKSEVQTIVMEHLRNLVPSLPEPASIKCQKWRYSQVGCSNAQS